MSINLDLFSLSAKKKGFPYCRRFHFKLTKNVGRYGLSSAALVVKKKKKKKKMKMKKKMKKKKKNKKKKTLYLTPNRQMYNASHIIYNIKAIYTHAHVWTHVH